MLTFSGNSRRIVRAPKIALKYVSAIFEAMLGVLIIPRGGWKKSTRAAHRGSDAAAATAKAMIPIIGVVLSP